jgi:hypothetical protein
MMEHLQPRRSDMPTTNPRINVTVSPDLDETISLYAEVSEISKSEVVRELLETVQPSLERVARMLLQAKRVKSEDMGTFLADMTQALNFIEQSVPEYAKGEERATALADARTEVLEPTNPLLSNRGVKTTTKAKTKGKPARPVRH